MLRTLLILVVICCGQLAVDGAERPNVLWIIADDLSPDLGCYRAEHVTTPHIDALADSGVRYTRAFATAPVCSSSRTAFITGMYQTTLGGHHHRTWNMPTLPEDVQPVTELFRHAGYFVTNSSGPLQGYHRGKTDYNFEHDTLYDGVDWTKRKPDQPFFAQIQIFNPHRPFITDDDPDRWQLLNLPPIYPDHPLLRKDWANYLNTVESLDQQVGQIMQRLEAEGVLDNTAIFFFGDHGRPQLWAKQWLYDAGIQVPLLIRLPNHLPAGEIDQRMVSLIDLAPTSLAIAGIPIPHTMQGRDMLAKDFSGRETIFAARDRCGDAVDRIRCIRTTHLKYIRNYHTDRPYMQLSGYKKLQYPAFTLLKVLGERGELFPVQSRFMEARRPAEELYDLRSDPYETQNLVDDPQYAADLARLRVTLETTLRETDDQGRFPEGDEAFMKAGMEKKRAYYEKAMRRRKLDPDISDTEYLKWWEDQLGL